MPGSLWLYLLLFGAALFGPELVGELVDRWRRRRAPVVVAEEHPPHRSLPAAGRRQRSATGPPTVYVPFDRELDDLERQLDGVERVS
jgi:hypothetical protein